MVSFREAGIVIRSLLDRLFRRLLAEPRGSEPVDWIVDSAQAEVELTPEMKDLGDRLYKQLQSNGHGRHREGKQVLVSKPVERRGPNPFSRRRVKRVFLNP